MSRENVQAEAKFDCAYAWEKACTMSSLQATQQDRQMQFSRDSDSDISFH